MKYGAAIEWFILVVDGHLLKARLDRSDSHDDRDLWILTKALHLRSLSNASSYCLQKRDSRLKK